MIYDFGDYKVDLTKGNLYKVKEVMSLLDISHDTIVRLIRHGQLDAIKVSPRRIIIHSVSLDRYLADLNPDHQDIGKRG